MVHLVSGDAERRFGALGISEAAERAYVDMLVSDGTPDSGLLGELVAAGLVHRTAASWIPVSPDGVVGAWASARAAEEAALRGAAADVRRLYDSYLARSAPDVPVQVLRGRDAVTSAATLMTDGAQEVIEELIRGPFLTGPEVVIPPEQPDAMARGVAYRVVYDAALMAIPEALATAQASIDMGEDARAFPGIPLRVLIVDGRQALVVLPHPSEDPRSLQAADADALLVSASPMLDALIRQFTEIWDRATPLIATHPGGTENDDRRRLIGLLALGMTDAAIARTLGISERTVHRRVAAFTAELGVTSRFQLGVEAERRGLLD